MAGNRQFSACDVIVFDWDGTIADSVALVVNALQQAAKTMGFQLADETLARQSVGLGLNELLARLLPDLPDTHYGEFIDLYRRFYFGQRQQIDVPFQGIPELIQTLAGQGRRLAVATGKSRMGLDRALKSTGLGRWFETSRCSEEGVSKPDPWMLKSLADEMGVQPSQMVMVGDTIHDIDMAHAFGCLSIGVHYGVDVPGVLTRAKPTALAGSVDELAALLGV